MQDAASPHCYATKFCQVAGTLGKYPYKIISRREGWYNFKKIFIFICSSSAMVVWVLLTGPESFQRVAKVVTCGGDRSGSGSVAAEKEEKIFSCTPLQDPLPQEY